MKLLAWGLTHPGKKREHNEDAFLINKELGLFAVADGMGGHMAGDRASRMAVELLEHEIELSDLEEPTAAMGPKGGNPGESAMGRTLREAARRTSRAIYDMGRNDPALYGMGTTLTALLFREGHVHVAHVGDSRCYLFRDNEVRRLTEDHSWTEEQVRAGVMTPAEANNSSLKHVITRSVGFESDVDVDVQSIQATGGDCFLVCSDGLYNYVDGEQLKGYLVDGNYAEAPRRLIDTANDCGGEDNITVLIVQLVELDAQQQPDESNGSPPAGDAG